MNCTKCGYWTPLCKCNGNGFNTPKDKLFEFTTYHLGKRFEIRDKKQWKKFMRKHGLNDDVDKMDFSQRDKRPYKPIDKKFVAEKMMEKLQSDGTYHRLVPELRNALKRR